jgi:hypothetical protein
MKQEPLSEEQTSATETHDSLSFDERHTPLWIESHERPIHHAISEWKERTGLTHLETENATTPAPAIVVPEHLAAYFQSFTEHAPIDAATDSPNEYTDLADELCNVLKLVIRGKAIDCWQTGKRSHYIKTAKQVEAATISISSHVLIRDPSSQTDTQLDVLLVLEENEQIRVLALCLEPEVDSPAHSLDTQDHLARRGIEFYIAPRNWSKVDPWRVIVEWLDIAQIMPMLVYDMLGHHLRLITHYRCRWCRLPIQRKDDDWLAICQGKQGPVALHRCCAEDWDENQDFAIEEWKLPEEEEDI